MIIREKKKENKKKKGRRMYEVKEMSCYVVTFMMCVVFISLTEKRRRQREDNGIRVEYRLILEDAVFVLQVHVTEQFFSFKGLRGRKNRKKCKKRKNMREKYQQEKEEVERKLLGQYQEEVYNRKDMQ